MKKFIRAVALANFRPVEMTEEAQIKSFEDNRPKLRAKYELNNYVDPTAIILYHGSKRVAYVNTDDKSWLTPLLDKSEDKGVTLTFDHVVHSKRGGHTILKYNIEVEKAHVDKVRPTSDWDNFKYTRPLIAAQDSYGMLMEAAHVLRSMLNGEDDYIDFSIQECVDDLCEGCKFDISIETTNLINECCIDLEIEHSPESIRLLEQLEEASTHRRSRTSLTEWTEWFENLVKSESANNLYKEFLFMLHKKKDKKRISKKMLESELDGIQDELLNIPQRLYSLIDNPGVFFYRAYYTNITRTKLHELLSALVLRRKIRQALGIENEMVDYIVNDDEQEPTYIETEWLLKYTEERNDKQLTDYVQQIMAANILRHNNNETMSRLSKMSAKAGEKKIEISVGNAGQVIANVEHLNNK